MFLGRGCGEGRLQIEHWPDSSQQDFHRLLYSVLDRAGFGGRLGA
jgi:hypothetical protein